MRVAKWGGSLAVRLPKALVEELGLKAGDDLALVEASGRLIVEKDERRRRAVERMRARAWSLPKNYRFDRDEANER